MRKSMVDGLAAELNGERRRWTEDDGRRVLEAWEASGESGEAFAKRIGIVSQRLFWWRKRLRWGSRSETGKSRAVATGGTLVPVIVRGHGMRADRAPIVVSIEEARVEVQELDAATAGWVALLVASLREGQSR